MASQRTPWNYLIVARLRAGYGSPTAAARALGVSLTHYCSVEAGRRRFSGDKLILAAQAFGVDVADLQRTQPDPPVRANTQATAELAS